MLMEIQSDLCLFMKSFLYHAGLDKAYQSIKEIVSIATEYISKNKELIDTLKSDYKKEVKLFKLILGQIFMFLLDVFKPCEGLYDEMQDYVKKLKAIKSIKTFTRIAINVKDFYQMISIIIQKFKDKLYEAAGELSAKLIHRYILGIENNKYHVLSDIIIGLLRSRGVECEEAQNRYGNFQDIEKKGIHDDNALEPLVDGISELQMNPTLSAKEMGDQFSPYFSLFLCQLQDLKDEDLEFPKTAPITTKENWNKVVEHFEKTHYEELGLKLGKIFKNE
jgi:hypothetical protein